MQMRFIRWQGWRAARTCATAAIELEAHDNQNRMTLTVGEERGCAVGEHATGWNRWKRTACGMVLLLMMMSAWTSAPAGQESAPSVPSRTNRIPSSVFDTAADVDPSFTQRRMRALNQERQKVIVSDTEKLLRLAQELSAEAQAGGGEPTTAQSVRVAEIEKLAHRVKQKMIESMADPPMPGRPSWTIER